MRHNRSVRTRLLAIVLISIGILTALNVLVDEWGIERISEHATNNSSQALQRDAERHLQRLAQERANATNRTLSAASQVAVIARDFAARSAATSQDAPPLDIATSKGGRRYARSLTTIILPPSGVDQPTPAERALLQRMDALLPGLAVALPEIARVSYFTPSGILSTYPAVEPDNIPTNWQLTNDPIYQTASVAVARSITWMGVHSSFDGSRKVISAITPIYVDGRHSGAIVVDIGLYNLTSFLERLAVEQDGFAFLTDKEKRLVAAPEVGQQQLLGRLFVADEQGNIALSDALPSLTPTLDAMSGGGTAVGPVELRGRQYIMAYAPVRMVRWSLGLAAPLDAITAPANEAASSIAVIVDETRLVGLIASLAVLVLLGLMISYWLRRRLVKPLTTLITATETIAAGDLQPIGMNRNDEIGQLAAAFDHMVAALQVSRVEITAAHQRLELTVKERTFDLELAVKKLEQLSASQQELLVSLRAASTPVIPVMRGVLAMPLVGQFDEERMQNATQTLLMRIAEDHARTILLDVTGVPLIDTAAAAGLRRIIDASRLLGAEVVLVGVAPEVAQTIVSLGIDMHNLRAATDIRSAMERLVVAMAR